MIPESESVLQSDTGSDTDVSGAALVGKFLAEGDKVGSLSGDRSISIRDLGEIFHDSWQNEGGVRGDTYKVNLRGVSELLLGIATLGRIWGEGTLQHLTGVHDVQRNEGCGGKRKKKEKRGGEKIGKKTLNPLWTRINQRVRHSVITTIEAVVERGFPVEEWEEGTGVFVDMTRRHALGLSATRGTERKRCLECTPRFQHTIIKWESLEKMVIAVEVQNM